MISLDSFERYGVITKKTYLKIALCSIQAFLCNSSTTVVLVFILWIAYLINIVMQNPKIMNRFLGGKKIFYIVTISFIIVIFFTTRLNFLQEISKWFGKDITFNGRTAIWRVAIKYIVEHPFFGAGPAITFDMGWGVNMTHAHCLYLNVFAHYGVLAVMCLLIIIWNALKKTKVVPIVVYFILLLYLIGSIVEVYSLNLLLLLCVVMGCYVQNDSLDVP